MDGLGRQVSEVHVQLVMRRQVAYHILQSLVTVAVHTVSPCRGFLRIHSLHPGLHRLLVGGVLLAGRENYGAVLAALGNHRHATLHERHLAFTGRKSLHIERSAQVLGENTPGIHDKRSLSIVPHAEESLSLQTHDALLALLEAVGVNQLAVAVELHLSAVGERERNHLALGGLQGGSLLPVGFAIRRKGSFARKHPIPSPLPHQHDRQHGSRTQQGTHDGSAPRPVRYFLRFLHL